MSMTEQQLINHVENHQFNEILTEMNKPNSELTPEKLLSWFTNQYFNTKDHTAWINFLTFLTKCNHKKLSTPKYLTELLSHIIEHEQASLEVNHERCATLLSKIIEELNSRPANNIMMNHLRLLDMLLISDESHARILDIIEKTPEVDKQRLYSHLLNLYVINPRFLFNAYRQNKSIMDQLNHLKLNKDQQYFLGTMEHLFNTLEKNAVTQLCSHLIDTEDNHSLRLKRYKNYPTLLELKRICTQSDAVLEKLRDLLKGNKKALDKLNALIKTNDTLEILCLTNQLIKFLDGYSNLTLNDGLLTCAQISDRKDYTFNPVAIDGYDEFSRFLNLVKNGEKPNRVTFFVADAHWISGIIEVNDHGDARMVILDSMGTTKKNDHHLIQASTLSAMENFNEIFPDQPIYFCKNKRQNTERSCAVFSLDDLAHLFTLDRHLQENLFHYFDKQPKKAAKTKIEGTGSLNIHCHDLPLSLLRTTQSRTTIDEVLSRTDKTTLSMPVNKYGDTFASQVNEFFKSRSDTEKKQNTRLEYKLENMAAHNAAYLLTHNKETVARHKKEFELDKFEQSLVNKSRTNPIPD